LALWTTVFLGVLGISIPQGFVASFADWMPLFGGFAASMLLSDALFRAFHLVEGWPKWLAYTTLHVAMTACAVLNCAADFASQFATHALFDTKLPSLEMRDVLMVQFYHFCLFGLNLALMWIAAVNRRSRDEQYRLAEARAQAAQAEAQAARAELAALHYQLNPHFLLNSLNSVSSLIMCGRHAEADETVVKLAHFLQAVLRMEPTARVSLTDELARMQSYLDIQRVRFADRFDVEIDCPEALGEALVPSLILQPIVKNTIKYAVDPSDASVTLRVRASSRGGELLLSVDDDGRAPAGRHGTGIGLGNVRNKLESCYGPATACTAEPGEAGFTVRLRLPLEYGRIVERRLTQNA